MSDQQICRLVFEAFFYYLKVDINKYDIRYKKFGKHINFYFKFTFRSGYSS